MLQVEGSEGSNSSQTIWYMNSYLERLEAKINVLWYVKAMMYMSINRPFFARYDKQEMARFMLCSSSKIEKQGSDCSQCLNVHFILKACVLFLHTPLLTNSSLLVNKSPKAVCSNCCCSSQWSRTFNWLVGLLSSACLFPVLTWEGFLHRCLQL